MNKNKKIKKITSVKRKSQPTVKHKSKKKSSWLPRHRRHLVTGAAMLLVVCVGLVVMYLNHNTTTLSTFRATPFNVVEPLAKPYAKPAVLLSPTTIKSIYSLTSSGTGNGTIAIIDAYDDPNIISDLSVFDSQFGLPACTIANGCIREYKMAPVISVSSTWAIEESLDVEWAHAIAPTAKILFVEARSSIGTDLLSAINYARAQSGVVAVSMSWGGNEFPTEANYESDFISNYGASFFAASGDNGHGTSWPAVSAKVISVGGTSLTLNTNGTFVSEAAWTGSGGGVSSYIQEPVYQKTYSVPDANGYRATPDVAYNADPNNGYAVYDTIPYSGYTGWFEVGGTSAGTAQWAAMSTLSNKTVTLSNLYKDAAVPSQTKFREIVSGSNGSCGYYCLARVGYNYVTGLGSPLTTAF